MQKLDPNYNGIIKSLPKDLHKSQIRSRMKKFLHLQSYDPK